jgi:hypothetical protein
VKRYKYTIEHIGRIEVCNMSEKEKTPEENENGRRPVPKGFVSIGMKKPYISSKKSQTVVICVPEHIVKQVDFKPGQEIEMFQNGDGDILVRFR